MNQAINDCLTGWNSLGKAFCDYAGSTFVQSALLVILLLALDVLWYKRVRAVFRYYVWLLVLLKLVLPPTLSLPTGIGYWVGNRLPAATGVSERIFPSMEQGGLERHPPAAAQASDTLPAVPPSTNATAPAAPAAPIVVPPTSLTWQGVVLLFWIAGVLTFVALLAQRLRFVRGLVAASTPAGRELLGVLEQCCRQMGVRRPVGLRTLDTLPSPAVCGLRRPMILLPAALVERLSPEGLQAALIHELAHIQRADLWINAVQTFLQILYFYHPFVWLANAIIRRTCEEAVDETVLVTLGGRAKNYSNTLIDISEMAFWKADFGLRLVGVAESRRVLRGRIKHMLTRPIPKSARIGTLGAIMILVVAAVLLPMAHGTPGRQSGTSSLMDRLQREGDPELAEMIRTAVANHQGASEKEILEITRRVTQSRAQILLLDEQIAQVTREIEAPSTSAETRGRLLLAKKEFEAKQQVEIASLRATMGIIPETPFGELSTAKLNAWVSLQVLEERVVVLDTFKPFFEHWYQLRHKVVGAFSQKETLDYLQGRLHDKKSLPVRIHIYYLPETKNAAEHLRQKIFALAREASAEMDADIRLERSVWVGSGESPFYLREGRIRTFYPQPALRPDGGPQPITSGLVDPNDLEQHILWRLTMPKNLPLTFRVEYDEASSQLAKQVANTAKAVAKRVGLADLVTVAGSLVESVPEKAFLGRWQALGNCLLQSIEVQPGGVCQVMVGEGLPTLKAGMSVRGTWVETLKEILLDIDDPVMGRRDYPPYLYRATVTADGNLLVQRGEIWPQGSFMFTRPPQMIFKQVPPQSKPARTELESERKMEMGSLREATGTTPRLPFAKQPTASLNARVSLQVLEQQVLVLDALKPLSEYWARARYTPVGLLSENEALDYVLGRLKDKRSLPLRIDIHYRPEISAAAQRLHEKIAALARETNTDMQTDLRLQVAAYAGSGLSTFFLREGKIRTFHPDPVRRPDGGPHLLLSGVVEVDDLEQHILWRLLHPGNVPLTFRIEYDEASSQVARQVADTAKAVVKRLGLTELVGVTGVLAEPVPETVFLGRWQAVTPGAMQTIDIQPGGVCLVTMDKGTQVIKAGANVPGMWLPTTKEIIVDIRDIVPNNAHYVYRAYVDTEGDLVVDRGVIYRQGSFHNSDLQPAVFRKVQ
jgi:beta-lactamase regulating signal transducer with metallopeptidase domain